VLQPGEYSGKVAAVKFIDSDPTQNRLMCSVGELHLTGPTRPNIIKIRWFFRHLADKQTNKLGSANGT